MIFRYGIHGQLSDIKLYGGLYVNPLAGLTSLRKYEKHFVILWGLHELLSPRWFPCAIHSFKISRNCCINGRTIPCYMFFFLITIYIHLRFFFEAKLILKFSPKINCSMWYFLLNYWEPIGLWMKIFLPENFIIFWMVLFGGNKKTTMVNNMYITIVCSDSTTLWVHCAFVTVAWHVRLVYIRCATYVYF